MAFGTTSSHGKRSPTKVSVKPKVALQSSARPRRGKVGGLWPAWQSHVGTLGLTPSQARFADVFFHGDNTCLAGEGGVGKSFITKALVEFLRSHRINVGVTGSTGVSAFAIGGQTAHSFFGLGLADEPIEQLITKVHKNRKAKDRIKAIDVLFLDETSMIKGELLDKIEAVCKAIRHCYEPFGGIQVCLSCDFLQLLPVFRGEEDQRLAFEADSWKGADIQAVLLKEQMRQQDGSVLLSVLSKLRVGDTSNLHLLNGCIDAPFPQDGIEPMRIFCKNIDVDFENKRRLAALTTPARTYIARDTGLPNFLETMERNCPAPRVLELKVGALVCLLANLDTNMGYCNGSIGVVQAFAADGVKVKFLRGTTVVNEKDWDIKEQEVGLDGKMMSKTRATRSQIPLKLAYASTVHRVQGQTLDRTSVDMTEAFAPHQIYCALSRVRDTGSLSIVGGISARAVRVNQKCLDFYLEIEAIK